MVYVYVNKENKTIYFEVASRHLKTKLHFIWSFINQFTKQNKYFAYNMKLKRIYWCTYNSLDFMQQQQKKLEIKIVVNWIWRLLSSRKE